MSQWTDAARAELESYFTKVRPSLTASGADADEVIEDLRHHLNAEVLAARINVVTEDDVRRLLARIGAPQPTASATSPQPAPVLAPRAMSVWPGRIAGFFLMLFGVILPAFTLGFELVTHSCAATFFDPIPSIWHVLLVAWVPVANLLTWVMLNRGGVKWRTWLGWVNGAAIGIGIFYSILYLPLMLPGVIGIIFFGFGLLPLAPVISLTATLLLRKKLRRLGGDSALPGFWRGLALVCLILAVVEAPVFITKLAMQKANSPERDEQLTGLRWLRAVGREETILRACYGFTARAANMDLTNWLIPDRVSTDKAREIYFRVTGRPFNSVPAPTIRTGRGEWAGLNEWTWDDDHGGERVGGRVKGLFLHSSRLDTTINADAAWSYTEWTMEFRNDSAQQREARAQILLPPGGVVSRLTLWVNGEEREAAFAGRSQTRKAYQEVAVQQRRDPVLVTTAGPDRVLMQCFPIQPSGGIMKVRVGVTAPLALENAADGITRLPMILERNFTLRKGFTHSVWTQSKPGLKCGNRQLGTEPSNGGQMALRGQLDDEELASPEALFRVARKGDLRFAWTKDTRDSESHFIRQSIAEESAATISNIVFVVDGSADMRPYWNTIASSLENAWISPTILVASDNVEIVDTQKGLKSIRPTGGQDNLPALLKAWDLAVQKSGSAIVWIHAPQPVRLESEQPLLQAIERSSAPPPIYEIQTDPGPDQMITLLDGVRSMHCVLRTGNLSNDLARVVATLRGTVKPWRIRRAQVNSQSEAEADGAVEGSLHVARLWANENVTRLQSQNKSDEAAKQASLYQLVTAVSGAVVLETQQQYAQTGLAPADPQTVPAIPEPGTWALMAVGVFVFWLARRRRAVKSSP